MYLTIMVEEEAPPLTDPLDGEEIELYELLEIFEDVLLVGDE